MVSEGFRVIYLDNRDCGLSFGIDDEPPDIPTLLAAQADPSVLSPAYSLSDMALDAIHLLNHVGQSGAHIVGVSMGGMIAQRCALEHPDRVFSLTSVMSTTGNPEVGQPSLEAIGALASNFEPLEREAALKRSREVNDLFGGPHYVSTEVGIGQVAEQAYDRALRPEGTLRQLAAIMTDGDRRDALREIQTRVLAIHGLADPLVDHSGSVDLIDTVPNGSLVSFDKMGHDLPEPLIPQIVATIVDHVRESDALR